jgi:hypothetical protein
MSKKAGFVLTPVGNGHGRYDVKRVDGGNTVGRDSVSGQFKTVETVKAKSKTTIKDIVRVHATGLKRLADR